MIEILPIRVLMEEDGPIFGSLNVALAKLLRADLPVAPGIVIYPKEISKIPIPESLVKETDHKKLFFNGEKIKSAKILWLKLLQIWFTEGLQPRIITFVKRVEAFGSVYFDNLQDDSVINVKFGKVHPNDLKKLDELVRSANKKLFIPHEYEWIIDGGVKLIKVLQFTPQFNQPAVTSYLDVSIQPTPGVGKSEARSAIKVFLDFSQGLVVEKEVDGVYISSEKIFDLNKPRESLEDLILRVVDAANTFPHSPILFKLADKSEGLPAHSSLSLMAHSSESKTDRQGMGQLRGTLRLLHQDSLREPILDALDFIRHKKGLDNVHIVIPFLRGIHEFLQMKGQLAGKKLARKNSLQIWMEIAVPENILNLENYLEAGLDGIVLNLDELISHLNGFDLSHEELITYKNEIEGLTKFLEDGIRLLHKAKIPFIAYGSLTHNPHVLEYLVEKGVYGVVVERYEADSATEMLKETEKKVLLRKST